MVYLETSCANLGSFPAYKADHEQCVSQCVHGQRVHRCFSGPQQNVSQIAVLESDPVLVKAIFPSSIEFSQS